ncbi:thioredoxin family protein [Candidatus Micrarchaeota archaeon]|nr:thioredoxin family protein [Candidatus Micrarchaeota archaeon]
MICLIALVVFAVLGIFSAKYRTLAREAADCVFRRMTLRPCVTGFDQRMKGEIVVRSFAVHPRIASFANKHFEVLSWIFMILMFLSFGYTVYGLYNLVTLGTCDPISGHCIFNPGKKNITDNICNITGKFIEFYGAECPHCQKMIPIVQQVEAETGVSFEKLETWHNETNLNFMQQYGREIEQGCGFMGVPTFFSLKTKKAVCGELSPEALKRFIRENG